MWEKVKKGGLKYCNVIVRPSIRGHPEEAIAADEQIPLRSFRDEGDFGRETRVVPDKEVRKTFSIPYFIVLISIIEVAVFIYHVVHLEKEHCVYVTDVGPFPKCSALIYNPRRRYEAWRLLTYIVVHSGWVHITSNVIGALLGSLMTTISDPTSYLAGASGGVYALLSAYLASVLLNAKEMKSVIEWLITLFFLVIGVIDLSVAIYHRYLSDDIIEENIGYVAHFGGALGGVLIGVNVLRNIEKEKWENHLRLVSFIAVAILVVACILLNATLGTKHFLPTDFSKITDCEYGHGCRRKA